MNINFSALNAFRNLEIQDNKAILVDVGSDRYHSVSTYKGPLSAMTRSEGERIVNNNMRENLMDALADAFGMKDEVKTVDGKKQYSTTLINTLEKHLGKDFKRADFGFTQDGSVSSGRPLTMRRVETILSKLENVNFNISAHEKLLNQALAKLDSMDSKSLEFAETAQKIQDATKLLQALKNDAKGEPAISYYTISDEYAITISSDKTNQTITTTDFSTIAKHITEQLGIPIDLNATGISQDSEPSEEIAHKLNTSIMNTVNNNLLELLAELTNR